MRLSLRILLFAVISVQVVVAVVILCGLIYSRLNWVMQEQISENLESVMRENSYNINRTLNYIYRAEKSLNTNGHFKSLLTRDYRDEIEKNNHILDLQNVLNNTYGLVVDESTNDYSLHFIVNSALPVAENLSVFRGTDFTQRYNGLYSDAYIKDKKWYQEAISSSVTPQPFHDEKNRNYIYFTNVIRQVTAYDNQVLGVVVVGVNFNRILDNITYMGARDALQIAIADRDGYLAASSGSGISEDNISRLLSEDTQHSGNIVQVSELDYGMKLVAVLDEQAANIRIQEFGDYFLVCMVLILAAALVCSVIISGWLTRPIRALSDVMKNIHDNQDIQIKTKLPSVKEIVSLYQSYNRMMFRISQLLEEAKQSGVREEELRMKMLQAQIKPHFLYNALDSISMTAMLHGENEISEMIGTLSDSFRYSISDPNDQIALGDEIKFIQNYVKFQEWRYEEKIVLETDIAPEDSQTVIPKFIIQPLVENSIVHGTGDEERTVRIKIAVEKTGDSFMIYVIDDGVGCDCRELNLHLAGGSDQYSLKFGLKNVNDRIRLKFGETYGIYYSDTPGGGLTARVTLPLTGCMQKGKAL